MVADNHAAGVGGDADDGEIQLPLVEDGAGPALGAGAQHHQHALLAFRQHDLVGGHAGLAHRHGVQVQVDAEPAFRGHFERRGGEAGGPHVLDGDDRIGGHQLEAGFDQQLLGEGIAHLHGRPLLLGVVTELGRRHGGAVNAVAAGLRADVDDGIADPGGGRIEDAVRVGDTGGHGVDQDVAVIAGMEGALAADGGHADAVAVAADAGDDAGHQMPGLGMCGRAEPEGVEVGDGAGAHGEDVAEDAADTRRRALVGLDVRRMVVAFHLEDRRLAVADVDDAGVLARPADHPRRLGRQGLQPHLG